MGIKKLGLMLPMVQRRGAGLSTFFKCTSTSLFTPLVSSTLLIGGTFFYSNWNISQEYLIQNFLKLEGTNYNFKWVKASGIASYLKKADFDPGLAINKYDQS